MEREFKEPIKISERRKIEFEKVVFRSDFIKKETQKLQNFIWQEEDKKNRALKEGYRDGEIAIPEEAIYWLKRGKRMTEALIDSQINNFKKAKPEHLDKRLEKNANEIEKLLPDLKDDDKKKMVKEKIGDIEIENRIIGAIQGGKM